MFEGCPSLVCLGSARLLATQQPVLQKAEPACLVTSLHWSQGLRRRLQSLPFSFCQVAVGPGTLGTSCGRSRLPPGLRPWGVTIWSKPLWYCLQSRALETDSQPAEVSARLHSAAGHRSVVESLKADAISKSRLRTVKTMCTR